MRRWLAGLLLALLLASPAHAVVPTQWMGDANFTMSATTTFVSTYQAFTAPRTIFLPSAASSCIGQTCPIFEFQFTDIANAISSTNTLTFQAYPGDNINGLSSFTVTTTGTLVQLIPISGTTWEATSLTTISVTSQIIPGITVVGGLSHGGLLWDNAGILGESAQITGLIVGNGTSAPSLYGGTSCTNQVFTALAGTGLPTCNSITNSYLTAGTFSNVTGVGTLTAGATGAGFTVALGSSTITGQLALANGGLGANLTANNGGIFYSTASAGAILTPCTNGQLIVGATSAAPACQTMSGDVSSITSGGVVTLGKVNGVTYGSGPSNNGVPVVTAMNTTTYEVLPSCSTSASALSYNNSTFTFGCNTITGSGTVNTGQAGQVAYYPGSTNAVNGNSLLNISTGGTLTIGAPNATLGALALEGSTSGVATVQPQATAGTPTLTLPNTTGTLADGVTSGTNVTLSLNTTTGNITAGWTGQLSLANGGTNASLTASNGGIIYSTGSALGVLAGTATANQVLLSGASTTPAWSTATFPATVSAGQTLAAASSNVWSATATPVLGAVGGTGSLGLSGTTSGTVTVTVNGAAGTWTLKLPTSGGSAGQFLETDGTGLASWANATGSGTVNSGTTGQLAYYAGNGTTLSGTPNASISAGALTLGTSGSAVGSVAFANATSGTVTIQPPTGALGSSVLTAPAATGTLALTSGVVSSFDTQTGTVVFNVAPQGRLTLVTGVPVMNSNQTAKGTIYYDCYRGNQVPYYTGAADAVDTIASCEVSTAMVSANSAGGIASAGVFDAWWVHSGANRICVATSSASNLGNGWAGDTGGSNTARGTGYSQLDYTTRPYITNKNSITNCWNGSTNYGSVSANQATYLGSFYSTAAGQTGMNFKPTPVAGGAAPILGLFNGYNRVRVCGFNQDLTTGWTYNTASYRAEDGSANNSVSLVDGLQQSTPVGTIAMVFLAGATANSGNIAIRLDSTNGFTQFLLSSAANSYSNGSITESFLPQIGYHTFTQMEAGTGGTNGQWSPSAGNNGLSVCSEM